MGVVVAVKAWILLSLLLIAGCSTVDSAESGPVAGSPEWFQTASQKEMVNYFRGLCVASGTMPGTREMAECIQKEAVFHNQSDVEQSSAVAAATAGN